MHTHTHTQELLIFFSVESSAESGFHQETKCSGRCTNTPAISTPPGIILPLDAYAPTVVGPQPPTASGATATGEELRRFSGMHTMPRPSAAWAGSRVKGGLGELEGKRVEPL